jgi:cyclopropane-fatty-acyl-phospholipid synthase
VILRSAARASDLRAVHLEDLTADYVRTLRCWRANFMGQLERVRALGYDRRFERRWELYLAYCEGGFDARRIGNVQLLLAKPGYVARPVRAPTATTTTATATLRPMGVAADALSGVARG